MFLRYKYRLKPTASQEEILRQIAGNQRFVWNYFLAKEIEQYQELKTFSFYNKNSSVLPSLKKEYEWLAIGPSQALQQTLKDLNNALISSFKGMAKGNNKKGFPKFKKKREFSGEAFRIVQTPNHWKYSKKSITLPKIGEVKWAFHRKIPNEFSTATVLLDGDKWYISIVVEVQNQQPKQINELNQVVGIDLNSQRLIVSSDGEVIDNPKFLKKSQKLLKRRQRQLAKTIKGSKRRKVVQLKLYNKHKKVRNQRTNFLHQISTKITNEYDLICTENLNVKGIQQFNGCITQDAGWAALLSLIGYKSQLKGKHTIKINRFAPSSKTCNNCGTIKPSLSLAEREYCCEHCGVSVDRDLNAALNIRDWGVFDFNTAGTAEIYGRGDADVGGSVVSQTIASRYASLNRQKFSFLNEREATKFT